MLERLRSKPDHIKKIFSLVLTLFIFSIIVFVWVSSRDVRLPGDTLKESAVSPLSNFTDMIMGIISDAKDKVSSMPSYTENMNSLATGTPAKKDPLASSTNDFDISKIVIIGSNTSTPTINVAK